MINGYLNVLFTYYSRKFLLNSAMEASFRPRRVDTNPASENYAHPWTNINFH